MRHLVAKNRCGPTPSNTPPRCVCVFDRARGSQVSHQRLASDLKVEAREKIREANRKRRQRVRVLLQAVRALRAARLTRSTPQVPGSPDGSEGVGAPLAAAAPSKPPGTTALVATTTTTIMTTRTRTMTTTTTTTTTTTVSAKTMAAGATAAALLTALQDGTLRDERPLAMRPPFQLKQAMRRAQCCVLATWPFRGLAPRSGRGAALRASVASDESHLGQSVRAASANVAVMVTRRTSVLVST